MRRIEARLADESGRRGILARDLADLKQQVATLQLEASFAPAGHAAGGPSADRLDPVGRAHIVRVLDRCGWRIDGPGHPVEVLGLHPNTLRSRMQRLEIERPAPHTTPRA